jgi:phosphopantetheinyl transferase (holo-ACP synthase)
MNPVHRMGPIFYASLPCDAKPPEGQGTNGEAAKYQLVSILWDHFLKMDTICLCSNRATFPIQIVHDTLGRPHLRLGEHRGPAISFSTAGKEVWAALCGDGSDIGIDVAESAEFQAGYPMHRVFHAPELHQALELAGGDLAGAAALLWSIKEAVAKALGCAFHLVDPRDIHVYPSVAEPGGPALSARLSGNARMRFPRADRARITVHSLARVGAWLSIAALIWPPQRATQPDACEGGQRD